MWCLALACAFGLMWVGVAEGKPAGNNFVGDFILKQILNFYAPTSKVVENEECRNHSLIYKEAAEKKLQWALQMLDSNTKVPVGIFTGNDFDFGNFDECLEVEDVATPSRRFSGQYCLVNVRGAGGWDTPMKLQDLATIFNQMSHQATSKQRGEVMDKGFKMIGMTFAVCVPSTCTPLDLELHFYNALQVLVSNITVSVQESSCSSRANSKHFAAADWFALCLVLFFAALVILSTVYDLARRKSESRNAFLCSFSVYSNGGKLLKFSPASSDTLQAVHGIRFLSMAWIVFGHTYFMFLLLTPSINSAELLDHLTDWNYISVSNATLSVDSFLLLSGLLLCYLFLNEMEKRKSFNVPLFYIHRYIRVTPAYGAMILLTATLFNYMGEGPNWERNMLPAKNNCQENWWANLLYINNYYQTDRLCLGQSWYLSMDTQLFWLSPLILYPLWKWPRFGKAILAILIVIGLIIAFLIPYIREFRFEYIEGIGKAGKEHYLPTHARFTPWLIGIGAGYLLHTTKRTRPQLSSVTLTVGWVLSAGLMLTSLFLAHHFQLPENPYNRLFESLYLSLMRPAWVLGLAWVVFACTTGYGGFVNTFLSWRFFQVLSRLTYTIYLTHITTMLLVSSTTRTAGYLSHVGMIMQFLSQFTLSIAAAFVLSMIFESPLIAIEKVLLNKSSKGEKQPGTTNDMSIKEFAVNDDSKNDSVQIAVMSIKVDKEDGLSTEPT